MGSFAEVRSEMRLRWILQEGWEFHERLCFLHVQHICFIDEANEEVKHLDWIRSIQAVISHCEVQVFDVNSHLGGLTRRPCVDRYHKPVRPIRHELVQDPVGRFNGSQSNMWWPRRTGVEWNNRSKLGLFCDTSDIIVVVVIIRGGSVRFIAFPIRG